MGNEQLDQNTTTGATSALVRWAAVGALGFFVACMPAAAQASGYTTLALPEKQGSISNIGAAPDKESIDLKLGDIRTREAQLPGGSTTLRERMAMRAKLREKRQMAVTMATREAEPAEGEDQAKPVSANGGSDIDLPPPPKQAPVDEFGMSDINM
ncbi:hypothetical protein [Ahrensia sp. R2A130]|uniref:hypothetical protein n=1 Tax=Ahrensia sp. R2A130 TaxID=744979 RepID=UPI0001E08CA8|nr:hypothetical protein [Ahrensia sp. R2A130]EFL88130.1 conserved hypothetical protein [Ahrensia sp. R2A130]